MRKSKLDARTEAGLKLIASLENYADLRDLLIGLFPDGDSLLRVHLKRSQPMITL